MIDAVERMFARIVPPLEEQCVLNQHQIERWGCSDRGLYEVCGVRRAVEWTYQQRVRP